MGDPLIELRALGRTGLSVSRIGLGLAALGRPGYMTLGHAGDLAHDYAVEEMERRCHAMLDAALAAGVRYLDAARSYGRAEEFLAHWLAVRGLSPDAVTVGSKWGYTYTAGWRPQAERHEVKDHSLATFTRQLGESRALLGAHLRLYQIHSATLESGVLDDGAVLGALARLRDAGIAVGLTVTGPRQAETLRRAIAIESGGAPLFQTVQATFNLFERAAEEALAEAHAAGLGVIIKEGVANGRLTDRNRDPEAAPLLALASRLGAAPDQLALAFVLSRSFADVVLSGAATPAQLASNLGATALALDDETRALLDGMRQAPEDYWRIRSALAWT